MQSPENRVIRQVGRGIILTTASTSLRTGVLEVNVRLCRIDRRGRAWRLCRKAKGTSLVAILGVRGRRVKGTGLLNADTEPCAWELKTALALLSRSWCFAITKRGSSWRVSAEWTNHSVGNVALCHHQAAVQTPTISTTKH